MRRQVFKCVLKSNLLTFRLHTGRKGVSTGAAFRRYEENWLRCSVHGLFITKFQVDVVVVVVAFFVVQ